MATTINPARAFAGMLSPEGPKFDRVGYNGESSAAMRFGIFVKHKSGTEKGLELLSAVTDKPVGITGFHHNYDRLTELDDTTGGVKPNVDLAVRQLGYVEAVRVEGTIAYGDRAHVRAVAGSGGSVLGVARAAAVAGETIDCSNLGMFVGPNDNGFAPFWVDAFADIGIANAELADGSVRIAKLSVFKSTEQTGNGSAQNVAHGLGVAPGLVIVYPTDTSPATAGDFAMTEGAHTSTNVIVTVTSGKKYKVIAIA